MKNSSIIQRYAKLIWFKALATSRVDLGRAYLGACWWVLEPVMYMVTCYLVFDVLLKRGEEGFVPFLLCGILGLRWFAGTVQRGAVSIVTNSALICQVYLPKIIFPLVIVVTNAITYSVIWTLFLLFLPFLGYPPNTFWLALPLVFWVQLFLIVACTCIAAAVMPLLPDLRFILERFLTALFFLSGVFYDIGRFSERIQFYFQFNPIATILSCYRHILLNSIWPDWFALFQIWIFSVIGILISIWMLIRFDRLYPKIVA